MEVYVPQEVVLNHILPRVPTKSVCRFRCVSKEWHSFLKSDMFINKHNRHVDDQKNNLKLLILSESLSSFKFATIDCEAPPSDKGLTPTHHPLPQFGGITPDPYEVGVIHVLTSFHGLVCLGIKTDYEDADYSDLILWNPLTNEYKCLPKPNFHLECESSDFYFELYYSCCEDDYKLLFFGTFGVNAYIYSLRSDSWREVDDAFQDKRRIYPAYRSRGTFFNENFYFVDHSDDWFYSIIRFDTKTERFSEIEPPYVDYKLVEQYSFTCAIMVISGCIHVCAKYNNTWISDNPFKGLICIKLWKLDEYDTMKEVLTFQLKPLHDDYTINYLEPFHLMQNGDWLMLRDTSSYNDRIYKVGFKKKMHITNKGQEKETGNIYDHSEYANVEMDNSDINRPVDREVGYIETFVSPNRYMK